MAGGDAAAEVAVFGEGGQDFAQERGLDFGGVGEPDPGL